MTTNHSQHNNHGTLTSYVIGFILSIALTIIPYFVVVNHSLSTDAIIITVVVVGIVQLLVQLIFFLHLNTSSDGRNDLFAFIFTFTIIAILVIGSLWIMYNMNVNMMIGH